MVDELAPPRKSVELEDPGAHELAESSDENDHFSDATEGEAHKSVPERSNATSPIPMTRVERVDDKAAYGEVPNTEAYEKRTQDAVPDELEIVPEGTRSRSASRLSQEDRPLTPGGTPIPALVVEKVDPDKPSYGDVPGTEAHEKRLADAEPDVVLQAPEVAREPLHGSPTSSMSRSPVQPNLEESIEEPEGDGTRDETPSETPLEQTDNRDGEDDAGDFGDDFNDFEKGDEADDFGDFDYGFQQAEPDTSASFEEPFPQPSAPTAPIPISILDYDNLKTLDDVIAASQSYMEELFPSFQSSEPSVAEAMPQANSVFLSERSLSLWSQLVAAPPLQPPNWVRSRIRRLFLVSLGVPVDLDEILPASKQKKLILPSINLSNDKSPRSSTDRRAEGAIARLKQANDSSASVNSSTSKTERRRRGPPPPPELDISSTTIICSTTEAALSNFTDAELNNHVERLRELQIRANEALEYWLQRKDSAVGDKEAFEGVIENLVKHAKKVRK